MLKDQTEAIPQVDSRQGRVFFNDLAAGGRQSALGCADVIDKELEDRRTGFSALVVQRYRAGIEPNHRIGIEHDRKPEFTRVVRLDGTKISARDKSHLYRFSWHSFMAIPLFFGGLPAAIAAPRLRPQGLKRLRLC